MQRSGYFFMQNRQVEIQKWGLIPYSEAWQRQEELFQAVVAKKVENRILPVDMQQPTPNYLVFCEHPHVFTLGKSGSEDNVLINQEERQKAGVSYYKINRGGDITYHGPGQLVCYPILDLDNFFTDIHRYLRYLEEVVIATIAEIGLEGYRVDGRTGVWVNDKKICAMGVRTSRWVTMHGLALNVCPDLTFFEKIVPCGISDKGVTSIELETGKRPNQDKIAEELIKHFKEIFEVQTL
jgi:lipoyl(octanoyl) transferase